jgi:D-ribose pyranase
MIQTRILNPAVLHLVSRIRHTNTLVIADYAFPYWPEIETVDLTLVKDVPTIIQVLDAIVPEFKVGPVFMAEEFRRHNPPEIQQRFSTALGDAPVTYEPHVELKHRVPKAIGLIRTGDTTIYGNLILESA